MDRRQVFFDFGGTLAAPPPIFRGPARVWKHVLGEMGWNEFSESDLQETLERLDPVWLPKLYGYLGRSGEFWHAYHAAVMDALGITKRRTEVDQKLSAIFEDPAAYRLFPDVRPVLRRLRAEGYSLGVISNASERLLRQIRHLGLDHDLTTIVFTQEVGAEKPDPRVFRVALDRVGCRPEQAFHVGDSFEADYLGATSAGIRGIWLNRDGRAPPQPCEMIRDLTELPGCLRK